VWIWLICDGGDIDDTQVWWVVKMWSDKEGAFESELGANVDAEFYSCWTWCSRTKFVQYNTKHL